jgi:hypothetical protein
MEIYYKIEIAVGEISHAGFELSNYYTRGGKNILIAKETKTEVSKF